MSLTGERAYGHTGASSDLSVSAWLSARYGGHGGLLLTVQLFSSPEAIAAEIRKLGQPISYAYDALADKLGIRRRHAWRLPRHLELPISDSGGEAERGAKKVVYPFSEFSWPGNKKLGVELFATLEDWLRIGVIMPNRIEVLPGRLNAVPGGLDRLRSTRLAVSSLSFVLRRLLLDFVSERASACSQRSA
ncbi:hypothetical protein L226DRAFT_558043, partial [Lentinus tigrinus ALCF2SS1-7]|uniref:uncharacterized protein n=1 Tax=Lentinus tigrinus ALCF2SS1-7 TaxID=1328758 RepID=UPI001166141F